jgi:ABC-2 type transport system permease protein
MRRPCGGSLVSAGYGEGAAASAHRGGFDVAASARRIGALVLRHLYLFRKSWPRVISLAYYPTVSMIMWAFVTVYLAPSNSVLRDAPGFFIGAVLLWDILFRGQLGVSLSFFEEMYSRNLGNLFVSPLRPWELIAGQLVMSVIRTLIGVGGAAVVAWLLFQYSIFAMGFALLAFFVNLIVLGWAIGLAVSGMVLRWGLGAEELAWAAIFLLAPISGVYYPIGVLPEWLQPIALAVPASYVFEGMRASLIEHTFSLRLFAIALALNAAYMVAGVVVYLAAIRYARERGMLLQMGE